MATSARSIDASAIFRAMYTACPNDPTTLLLDVRPNKEFKKRHINQAFNVRVSSNGAVLVDYSQSSYSIVWSQAVWWGKPVIVYGHADLSKSHPVINFLVQEGRCAAVLYYKNGYEAFEKQYPFLCTASVKANSIKRYPSQVLDLLYLGDWGHAQDQERLDEIKVRRIITIHNNPENLKPPPHVQQLRFTLADVDTADISHYFNAAYEFIEDAMRKEQAVLVHCGAGVSRSACLVIMYLMRSKHWSAKKARDYVVERRSLVCLNDGFWRTLCSLEAGLGIVDRSDPTATSGFHGVDATAAQLSADAAGTKVPVQFEPAGSSAQEWAASTAAAESGSGHDRSDVRRRGEESGSERDRPREGGERRGADRRHERDGRSRDNARGRGRSRSRERSRSRGRRRDRSRDGSEDCGRRQSRDRSSDRRRPGDDGSRQHDRRSPAAGTGTGADATATAVAARPKRASAADGWELVFEVSKPEAMLGKLVLGPMSLSQRIVFGREPACDVIMEHLSVSRRHAQLGVDATGSVSVTDLGSAHGTKVAEVWLKPHAPRTLAVGATMRFGASTRIYKLLQVRRPDASG